MPVWLDRPSSKLAAGTAGAALALAGALAPLALARTPVTHGNAATWNSNAAARSIATTVYVAALNCAAVPKGSYSGQQSGIELFGRYAHGGTTVHPADFAGVYSYCHGKTAVYSAQFVVANTGSGELTFERAGFKVKPGDPLSLAIKTVGGHELLSIRNVNTKQQTRVQGPLLEHGFGWSAGTMPIDAAGSGAPATGGLVRLGNEYALSLMPGTVNGPARSAPVVFDGTAVGGHRISHSTKGAYRSHWTGTGGHVLASASSAAGGNFNVALRSVARPRLAQTAALTRVGGRVTFELPGSHRFVHLTDISGVPDGTVIDADHGSVQITLALPGGSSQTGVFYSGEFTLNQRRSGQTTATLAGGSYAGCPTDSAVQPQMGEPQASTAAAKAAKAKGKKTKVSGLWSNAHGSFTTKGSYGAAAVLGTRWYTEDRCDGTYFYVERDRIKVTSYYPTRHRVLVRQGHSYLARAVYPAPNGTLTATRLGSLALLQTRDDALAAYPFGTSRGFDYKYYFKLAGGGIRIGFATPQLLATLPAGVQSQVDDRVVWISTWSDHYAIDGIHVHATLAALQQALPGGQTIAVGSNDWYLAPFGANTAVFKIDDGTVRELGITLASVTTSRDADQTLMGSFDS